MTLRTERRLLLVDGSGRGHTFADLLVRTNGDVIVHYAPGCAAVADGDRIVTAPSLNLLDPVPMVEYASRSRVDLVVVTNTQALANGFVDAFRSAGFRVIGPDRRASRLESSKVFAKALFSQYGIPTPEYRAFYDPAEARAFVLDAPYEVVVKADGLCGGNGSFVCESVEDALVAIDRLMVERVFGEAGASIVVEQRLRGPEFSFFALVDRSGFLTFPMAVDYPMSDDGNRGVGSGGMGSLSHHSLDTEKLVREVESAILKPLIRCISAEGLAYTGFVYLGCMLVDDRPTLLEVNVRMGEPEAEVVLTRVESDFLALCEAVLADTVGDRSLELNDLHYCDVVATQGPTVDANVRYPGWPYGAFGRHYPISGIENVDREHCRAFIGEATVLPEKGLVTDGGRVLHVVGFGDSSAQSVERSYENIAKIHFDGIRYRSDIGRVMPWAMEEGAS
jgi:phosphoribosylamine--glycine ligase